MKRLPLSRLSDDEIVRRFVDYAIEQENMSFEMRSRSVTRLYHKIDALVTELRSREGDHRHVLLPFLKHANPQVRLKAAQSLLAVAPDEALAALKELTDHQLYLQALDAGMTLYNIETGVLVPK